MSRCAQNKILFRWSRREKDWRIWYPRSVDGSLVMNHLALYSPFPNTPPLVEELIRRGYQPDSIRFEAVRGENDND